MEFLKIDEKDLKEAGMIVEVSKVEDPVPGPSAQTRKMKFIKIDQKEFEEAGMVINDSKILERKVGLSSQKKKRQFLEIDEEDFAEAAMHVGVPKLCGTKEEITKSNAKTLKRRNVSDVSTKAVNTKNADLTKTRLPKAQCVLTPRDSDYFGDMKRESKFNIRKNLFGISSDKSRTAKPISTERKFKAPTVNSSSPLIYSNKAEKKTKDNGAEISLENITHSLPKPTPSRLSIIMEENQKLTPSEKGSTSNIDSDSDFIEMEKLYEAEETNGCISRILSIIQTDQEEFKKYQKENQRRISEILSTLQKLISEKKENDNKKCIKRRLSKPKTPNRTPLKNIGNGYSLRRNVLVQNVNQSTVVTPKHKKAERMYNSLRDKYLILETPRFNSSSSSTGNANKSISMKLHEQCLMLLDTPEHN